MAPMQDHQENIYFTKLKTTTTVKLMSDLSSIALTPILAQQQTDQF